MHEFFGRGILEQEPACTGAKPFEDIVLALESSKDDNPTWMLASREIRPVASRPSIVGIWTSMSTTSGRTERTMAIACSPSLASPTTSMSSSLSRIILKPVLINA